MAASSPLQAQPKMKVPLFVVKVFVFILVVRFIITAPPKYPWSELGDHQLVAVSRNTAWLYYSSSDELLRIDIPISERQPKTSFKLPVKANVSSGCVFNGTLYLVMRDNTFLTFDLLKEEFELSYSSFPYSAPVYRCQSTEGDLFLFLDDGIYSLSTQQKIPLPETYSDIWAIQYVNGAWQLLDSDLVIWINEGKEWKEVGQLKTFKLTTRSDIFFVYGYQ